MGLGTVHTVSLAEARKRAEACRKQVLDGIDPIGVRDAEKAKCAMEPAAVRTFRWCAQRYLSAHGGKWKNLKHARQWQSTLERYAFPTIAAVPVGAVDTAHVLEILEPIWNTVPETASRLRGRIEAILDWATACKLRTGENPARWRGHMDKLLPAPAKIRRIA